jgi:hypothetical protein
VSDDFLARSRKHIDHRDLWHCVATWLQAHRSTSYVHQFLERSGVWIPVELCLCLGWITPEIDNICWTVEIRRNLYEGLANQILRTFYADTLLVLILAFPLQFDTYMMESQLGKFSYRVLLTSSDDKVLWLFSLEDKPHTLYIVLRITPVTQRIQVAEIEFLLLTLFDAGCSKSNLAGNESLATALTLMIEEDTRAAEHIVSLTILLDNPETVLLSYGVWRIWVEWCILVLRNLLYLAIKLGCGSLIHTAGLLQTTLADSLQDTEHTCSIYIGCKLRRVKTYLNVALSGEVINFGWFHAAKIVTLSKRH